MDKRFELLLFSTNTEFIRQAVEAGVDGVIVDWENAGKEYRQSGADTQINFDTLEDLVRVRASTKALVVCRINGFYSGTPDEVRSAISAGADEILLPMVRSAAEVEKVLKLASGRARVGILIETVEAVELAAQLCLLPLSRVFIGLNDLAIQRGYRNIFLAIADGTVERVARVCDKPFGFGGLTLPERGFPIPCRLFIGEMARLGCKFGFLRRSFLSDIKGREMKIEIPRIRKALDDAASWPLETMAQNRSELLAAIASWKGNSSR